MFGVGVLILNGSSGKFVEGIKLEWFFWVFMLVVG